jgi:hypothetical protein
MTAPAKRRKAEALTDPHSLDVERAVSAIPQAYAMCRDYGHPWAPSNVEWLDAEQCYRVTLKCPRCSTLRTILRNRRGSQLESHYDYPDGYAIKGLGPLSGTDRDQIRLRSMGITPEAPAKSKGRKAS